MWKRLLRVNTADWHSAAGKAKTGDIFERDVQTRSDETSSALRENVEVKSLSLTAESPVPALRCPRTIAGDGHISQTIWLIRIDVPQRTDFTVVSIRGGQNSEKQQKKIKIGLVKYQIFPPSFFR